MKKNSTTAHTIIVPAILLLLSSKTAFGQWTVQTIELENGWNAVYLKVQIESLHCYRPYSLMDKKGCSPDRDVYAADNGNLSIEALPFHRLQNLKKRIEGNQH